MALLTTQRCIGCGDTFSSVGRGGSHCAPCCSLQKTRKAFGESEVAERWIAHFYPHDLEQERRCVAYRQRLRDEFARVVASGQVAAHDFTDS